MDHRLEVNRINWDERTPVHAASDFYDVESFRKGRITLADVERQEVGDVAGKTLLHLQCHFGLDTMSWARLGAKATGVDFSGAAINLARELSEESGLGVRFINSNLYDLPNLLGEQFDIVFTSYGALTWLPDISGWARVVNNHLKPGGMFYMAEFHPFAGVFVESEEGVMAPTHSYFHHQQFLAGSEPSYAGREVIKSPTYQWQHSLGEIICALIDAGLRIEFLHEFPFTCYQAFPSMERGKDGWWRLPQHNDSFPQTFSIRANKPSTGISLS
ncbi:MAG: class I SAM-dependent methyltransferase [Chloroflexi bacterium]|nr:class I SAM-dependent methyltransferase [Chloroflexota bacterium]